MVGEKERKSISKFDHGFGKSRGRGEITCCTQSTHASRRVRGIEIVDRRIVLECNSACELKGCGIERGNSIYSQIDPSSSLNTIPTWGLTISRQGPQGACIFDPAFLHFRDPPFFSLNFCPFASILIPLFLARARASSCLFRFPIRATFFVNTKTFISYLLQAHHALSTLLREGICRRNALKKFVRDFAKRHRNNNKNRTQSVREGSRAQVRAKVESD